MLKLDPVEKRITIMAEQLRDMSNGVSEITMQSRADKIALVHELAGHIQSGDPSIRQKAYHALVSGIEGDDGRVQYCIAHEMIQAWRNGHIDGARIALDLCVRMAGFEEPGRYILPLFHDMPGERPRDYAEVTHCLVLASLDHPHMTTRQRAMAHIVSNEMGEADQERLLRDTMMRELRDARHGQDEASHTAHIVLAAQIASAQTPDPGTFAENLVRHVRRECADRAWHIAAGEEGPDLMRAVRIYDALGKSRVDGERYKTRASEVLDHVAGARKREWHAAAAYVSVRGVISCVLQGAGLTSPASNSQVKKIIYVD